MKTTKSHKKQPISSVNIEKKSWTTSLWFQFFLIAIIVFVVFSPVLNNSFLMWDDDKLIVENPFVKDLSLSGIIAIFKHSHQHDPITVLSHAITYYLFGFSSFWFHLGNLLLHIANAILVYVLLKKFFNKTVWIFLATILFAIHPMKVESVAWASERKDVLYTFFFLLALLSYLKYMQSAKKAIFYLLTFMFMFLSIGSKLAAMVLPIVLLLFDYWKGRKFNFFIVLEKIPFFIIAFIMIYINAHAVDTSIHSELLVMPHYHWLDRITLSFYSFGFYLIKFILPINLIAVHPYPELINGFLSTKYYVIAAFIVCILLFLLYFAIKQKWYQRKQLFTGILFFIVLISPVLHIVPIKGVVVVADRYTYLAYFGLILVVFELNASLKHPKYSKLFMAISTVYCIWFAIASFQQSKVWKNTFTLFNDVIEKDNENAFAYWSRANVYASMKKNDAAIADYSRVVELKPNNIVSYHNRGNLKAQMGDLKGALADFNTLISLQDNLAETYLNRGNIKKMLGDDKGALQDYNKAIELNPHTAHAAYCNRGVLLAKQKQWNEAIEDFNRSLALQPDFIEALINRALTYFDMHELAKADKDYEQVLILQPNNLQAINGRGNIKLMQKDYNGALSFYNKVLSINPNYAIAYFNAGYAYFNSGQKAAACQSWENAWKKGYQPAKEVWENTCQNK